jgi:hypothetical protein
MSLPITKVNIFLLAGVATAPLFMENFRLALTAKLEQAGCEVHSELLFPYGDWSRKLLPQLLELRHDLWAARSRPLRSIGGARVAAAVRASAGTGTDAAAARAGGGSPAGTSGKPPLCPGSLTLLIGHSGGGVAAVHAASILALTGEPAMLQGATRAISLRVVQVGSPKCPIPNWLKRSLLYVSAINAKGRPTDPVALLGSWRVWQRNRLGLPVWRPSEPASQSGNIRLQLMGGHPDYFRDSQPFLNQHGLSNLELTVQAVMDWLESTFPGENRF